jgi:hypothetical protein
MPLSGTFGTATNINTTPTFKLLFPDPAGTMTLANLPTVFSQLQAIQFPTLHLSTTDMSETWSPSVSTFNLGLINTDEPPEPCSPGCRYSFSLAGKVQGINPASPLYQYNGDNYIVSGAFNGAGALNIDFLKIAAGDPNSCSGGGCVGAIPPDS